MQEGSSSQLAPREAVVDTEAAVDAIKPSRVEMPTVQRG